MAALFLLAIFTVIQTGLSYNCLNTGYDCINGGICDYFGRCRCPPGYEGYNCGLDSKTISNATVCTAKCQNKGICYNATKCYCTDEYLGDTCEISAINFECGMTSVKIRVYRPKAFIGEMFLKQSMFNCKLRELYTNKPGLKLFELDIPHTAIAPCALKKTVQNTTGDTVYSVEIATSHNKNLFSMSDTVHRVQCKYEARKMGPPPIDKTKALYPVKIRVVDSNNDPITQVQFNDAFSFVVEPTGHVPDVQGVRVTFLEAFAINPTTTEVKTIKLIEDECPVQKTSDMLGFTPSNTLEEVMGKWISRVDLKGFTIPETENLPLQFDYRVKFCRSKCYEKACNSPPPPVLPPNPPFRYEGTPIEIV